MLLGRRSRDLALGALEVEVFCALVASQECQVVHLALRALRISVERRVPSTLRGEGPADPEYGSYNIEFGYSI